MARYGIFGGTFDPVHTGHTAMAQAAKNQLKLDKVFFVPTRPWQKTAKASDEARKEMLELALRDADKSFAPDFRELERAGASYSIDTLFSFRKEFPEDELFFILGGDQWDNLKTWVLWEKFPELSNIALFPRGAIPTSSPYPGKKLIPFEKFNARPSKAGQLILLDGPFLPVSSTELRKKLKEGTGFSQELINPRVLDYIRQRRLYGSTEE